MLTVTNVDIELSDNVESDIYACLRFYYHNVSFLAHLNKELTILNLMGSTLGKVTVIGHTRLRDLYINKFKRISIDDVLLLYKFTNWMLIEHDEHLRRHYTAAVFDRTRSNMNWVIQELNLAHMV